LLEKPIVLHTTYDYGIPVVAERHQEQPQSMLTMAIPYVEISTVRLFAVYGFNLFVRWHQRLWFNK